jgi:hypothetical protein
MAWRIGIAGELSSDRLTPLGLGAEVGVAAGVE